jgi:threonylcarbamoyladenosine tRNA methylthiotransferase MtaB
LIIKALYRRSGYISRYTFAKIKIVCYNLRHITSIHVKGNSMAKVVTFGCRLNIFESEGIKSAAHQAGLEENTIIFNSCAVTSEAERQLRQAIRKARKEDDKAKIIVTGCAAQINPAKYSQMPEVDLVIGNAEKGKVESYTQKHEKVVVNDIMELKETAHQLVESFDNHVRGYLQIQNGCNHRCTFCIIPYGRGNSRSVPIAEIVQQARILVDKGYNELVLTGVDMTSYGEDLPGQPRLGQMVKRLLSNVPNLKRLRISSIDVAEVDEDLIDLITHERRLMPHLHLSLQAGDNMILKRMKRRHTREQAIEFCHRMRELRSDIAFGADIIAGFPTESEEMFLNSKRIVSEIGLAHLHVFPYSEREGTPAARMPQVEKAVRKERARVLREEGEVQLQKLLAGHMGKELSVIVEKDGQARAEDYCLVQLESQGELPALGSVVTVKITSCTDSYLVGQVSPL